MKMLFELATGETLTLESLRYYLSNLAECGRTKCELAVGPSANVLVRAPEAVTSPYLLLGALADHIDRFQHAIYNTRNAETMALKERKAEVDQVLSWFLYNVRDEMGAQFRPALEVLGLSVEEFFGLMKAQLRYDDAALSTMFGEARKAHKVFQVIDRAEKLFRSEVVAGLTKDDTDLAWQWMQRYTVVAFSEAGHGADEALRAAKKRAALMTARAEWFAKADPDLTAYALGQLEVDGRIKL